jgi:DNA-binding transcriptional ArsR family regulator
MPKGVSAALSRIHATTDLLFVSSATTELQGLVRRVGVVSTDAMVAAANLVEIAALVGDTARATALNALMGGQALTTSELAGIAGVAKSTMSEHLARLERAGLVSSTVHRQFKYYRIASARVAQMMESIKVVAAIDCPPRHQPKSAKDDALRTARTCYDHFAGRFGVSLADALVARNLIDLTECGGEVTAEGMAFFRDQKIDLNVGNSKRVFCRSCLDWSERRYHIAGIVGASMCRTAFERGWVARVSGTRAISVTTAGRRVFRDVFDVDVAHSLERLL